MAGIVLGPSLLAWIDASAGLTAFQLVTGRAATIGPAANDDGVWLASGFGGNGISPRPANQKS